MTRNCIDRAIEGNPLSQRLRLLQSLHGRTYRSFPDYSPQIQQYGKPVVLNHDLLPRHLNKAP